MLLSTQQCLATASGHVCSKGFGLSILRERQRAFRPSFFYGATNDSFLKSRAEEGLICFVAGERRPEPWLWVFEEEGARDSAILIRELDEALQKKTPSLKRASYSIFFFSFSIQWMLDEKWMNVTDYRMHEWICVPVPLFHLYISTFLLAYNSFHFLKECSNLFRLYM